MFRELKVIKSDNRDSSRDIKSSSVSFDQRTEGENIISTNQCRRREFFRDRCLAQALLPSEIVYGHSMIFDGCSLI